VAERDQKDETESGRGRRTGSKQGNEDRERKNSERLKSNPGRHDRLSEENKTGAGSEDQQQKYVSAQNKRSRGWLLRTGAQIEIGKIKQHWEWMWAETGTWPACSTPNLALNLCARETEGTSSLER
jgi:hypothetical protein